MAVTIGTNSGFVTASPSADPSGSAEQVSYTALVTKDTSPAGAVRITEVGWWCDNATEESNFEMALYAADGAVVPGEAGTRLYVDNTNAKGTDAGWIKITVDWEIDPETDYWIGLQVDQTATITNSNYKSSGAFGRDRRITQTTLSNPFGGGALSDSDGAYTFYALVEIEATGTNTQINIGDAWKEIALMKINIGDTWKDVSSAQINIGDSWKIIF